MFQKTNIFSLPYRSLDIISPWYFYTIWLKIKLSKSQLRKKNFVLTIFLMFFSLKGYNFSISVSSANPVKSTPFGTSSNAESCVMIGKQMLNGKSASSSLFTDVLFAIALTAGRGDAKNEVGLAAIELQYPYLSLCQISDCQTYVNTLTKINVLGPIEVSTFRWNLLK